MGKQEKTKFLPNQHFCVRNCVKTRGTKMVCISCIVIPVVLWLRHRFLRPLVLKFWNPWQPAVEKKSIQTGENDNTTTNTSGGSLKCPFSSNSGGGEENNPHLANGSSVKNDIKQNANTNGHVKAD